MLMDIFEEYLNEASFLWTQWERALIAPDYNLEETAVLEERLLAHLDGLVLGGEPVADALLVPALESKDPPRMSAALWALLAEPARMDVIGLISRVKDEDPQSWMALGRALELNERREVGETLVPWLKGSAPVFLSLVIEVLAFRGQLPRGIEVELLRHPDARVVVSTLRSVLPLPREAASRELLRLLVDARPNVRNAAIEAGMVSGVQEAWEACRNAVNARAEVGRGPLVLLALGGNERDLEQLLACTGVANLREDAIWALGFSGRLEAADACLSFMGLKSIAEYAGESFCAITGLKLEGAYKLSAQEEESLPPLEEDLSRDLELRPKDALPVPARDAVATWWKDNQKKFARGTRYLRGRVFGLDGLLQELEHGPMRRRHVLALELALRSQGACQLWTRTFTRRQRETFAQVSSAGGRLVTTPFLRMPGY